ncbi:MAG: PCRF domain-containing protein, partial [Sulfurovum sp.]
MLQDRLKPFINRYDEITSLLSSPDITNDIKKMTDLSREQSNMSQLVEKAKSYIANIQSIEENKLLLDDEELGELAKEELIELEASLPILEEEMKILLIPKDPNDDRNIFLELRAGAGGDESALFVADVFKMYLRFAESVNWKVEIVSSADGSAGGYKEIIAQIRGTSVYSKL